MCTKWCLVSPCQRERLRHWSLLSRWIGKSSTDSRWGQFLYIRISNIFFQHRFRMSPKWCLVSPCQRERLRHWSLLSRWIGKSSTARRWGQFSYIRVSNIFFQHRFHMCTKWCLVSPCRRKRLRLWSLLSRWIGKSSTDSRWGQFSFLKYHSEYKILIRLMQPIVTIFLNFL
jgi:hypothetical protein